MNRGVMIAGRSLSGLLLVAVVVVFLTAGGVWSIVSMIPSPTQIRGCLVTKLYSVKLCPGSKDYVPLNQISSHLQKAVVLSEDSAFWTHNGFDYQEIQRSLEKNMEEGRFARGGSTITQQLAKNLFLTAEKTLIRKAIEAVITIRIESALTKRQILERYLNVVQFGPDVFGVRAASRFYFEKTPAQLDVLESAFLAFLLPNPVKYSVSFYKKRLTPFARTRLREIMDRLYQYERIDASDYQNGIDRLAFFLSGGQPPEPPGDLNIDAPEEGAQDDSILKAFEESVNRHAPEDESKPEQDNRIDQEIELETIEN